MRDISSELKAMSFEVNYIIKLDEKAISKRAS